MSAIQRPLAPISLPRGSSGAVVAPHHLASLAGVAILRDGGSAVDAAIATNAVLSVVYGSACGLGGDAFWLIWDEAGREQLALNGSGRSGSAASAEKLLAAGLDRVPLRGGQSITVPGAVRSWADAHRRFGRLSRETVLAPAIELAEGGFPAWEGFIEAVERCAPIFADALGTDSPWRSVYRPTGRAWQPGERVRLPALAATLRRLVVNGWDEFYHGETATSQARALAAAGSSITAADLADHASSWSSPIGTDYRGVRVTTHPPNSAGFVALEILNVLGQFEPPDRSVFEKGSGANVRWTHLAIEATKLAMADRDHHLTDPEARAIPLDRLLDKGYAAELASRIDPAAARPSLDSPVPSRGGTIWLGAVDRDGMAVSLIESNYMTFGSGVLDPASGVVFQNRGSYFSLEPAHANVLAASKRTLHTLMPGMLFRDGRPWVVVGSMGGDAQPQIHAQVVSALVDGGVDVATAVAMPRWFVEPEEHFAPARVVRAEPRFRPGLISDLRALGHEVTLADTFDSLVGHCHAIEIVRDGNDGWTLAAATDPRSAGLPAVW